MISNLAYIEKGAIIGENVVIEPFAYIGSKVKLANGVKVLSHAKVVGDTDIGENTIIHPFSVIGGDPQDISYKGEDTKLIIGKNNIFRECVTVNKGTLKEDGITEIGDNNLFMATVHIAHDCKIGNNVIVANGVGIAGHVRIEDNAFIGGISGIHQFVRIGTFAMVAGLSAVTQDVPPYCLVEGNRAKVVSLNLVGLRRHLKEKESIDKLKVAFKKLFRENRNIKEVAKEILKSETDKHVKRLCEFILSSKRGIPLR